MLEPSKNPGLRTSPTECPLCGCAGRVRFAAHGIPILDCPGCGHRFAALLPTAAHIEAIYADDYFRGGGAGYPDYFADAHLLRRHGRRCGERLARFRRPGRILDVGAAAGFLMQGMADTGWTVEGIEPNAAMAAFGRSELGLTIHTGTLDTARPSGLFDAVAFIQVLAHFPDPLESFRRADALTKPGGVWLVETWDAESRTARAFGRVWHEYSPPSVLHWWSKPVLNRTLAGFGYRLRGTGHPQKWIGLRHAKSLLIHKLGGAGRMLKHIPEGLAVPYPSEDLFWSVYDKGSSPGAAHSAESAEAV